MDTVALIFANKPTVIIPREVAQAEYRLLSQLTLAEEADRELFAALTVALGVLPPPIMGRMPDGRTRSEAKLTEWREVYKELNGQA